MNARLTLPNHRYLTPLAAALIVIAFAATLALGFGLRAWTEDTPQATTPAAAISQVRPAAPQDLMRLGKPW
jgi:hypothetical protein